MPEALSESSLNVALPLVCQSVLLGSSVEPSTSLRATEIR